MQKTEMCALEGEKETCERPQSRQHPLPQHQVRLVLVSLEASLDRFKTGKYQMHWHIREITVHKSLAEPE